jgi:aminomuconate-semialdehyde dehydrogenase
MGECSRSIASLTAEMLACNTLAKAQTYLRSLSEPISMHSYIAGSFKAWDAESTSSVDSFEPKTGRLIAKIPNTSEADVELAIHHAKLAFPAWSKTPRSHRSDCLRRIANLIQENRELLAVWESIDQGKTLERARVEVDRAVSNFS